MKRSPQIFLLIFFSLLCVNEAKAACWAQGYKGNLGNIVYGVIECAETLPGIERKRIYRELSTNILKRWDAGWGNHDVSLEAGPFSRLIFEQSLLNDIEGRNLSEKHLYWMFDDRATDDYQLCKALIFLASVWSDLGEKDKLKAVLDDMISRMPNLPSKGQDHKAPKKFIADTVLDFQKRLALQ